LGYVVIVLQGPARGPLQPHVDNCGFTERHHGASCGLERDRKGNALQLQACLPLYYGRDGILTTTPPISHSQDCLRIPNSVALFNAVIYAVMTAFWCVSHGSYCLIGTRPPPHTTGLRRGTHVEPDSPGSSRIALVHGGPCVQGRVPALPLVPAHHRL
jgi:hypothetical protein